MENFPWKIFHGKSMERFPLKVFHAIPRSINLGSPFCRIATPKSYGWNVHGIWGICRQWTSEESIAFWKWSGAYSRYRDQQHLTIRDSTKCPMMPLFSSSDCKYVTHSRCTNYTVLISLCVTEVCVLPSALQFCSVVTIRAGWLYEAPSSQSGRTTKQQVSQMEHTCH